MANINTNINTIMQSYTNTYNEALTNYLALLNQANSQWKQNTRVDIKDYDAITVALATLLASAEAMKNKAQEYMDGDITLLREAQANYEKDVDTSVLDDGSIIEATGRAFDKYGTSRALMLQYTDMLAESREYYTNALQCYTNALAQQMWWTKLVQTLKEENKNKKSYRPGAVFDAISAFGEARGRINKTTLRKRKPRKRKHKNRTARR